MIHFRRDSIIFSVNQLQYKITRLTSINLKSENTKNVHNKSLIADLRARVSNRDDGKCSAVLSNINS